MEAPSIPEIDEAAEKYVRVRDRRMKLTTEEVTLRETLIETVKQHIKDLTANGDGELHYRYGDDMEVILKPGKEKVKVRHASADSEEEEE